MIADFKRLYWLWLVLDHLLIWLVLLHGHNTLFSGPFIWPRHAIILITEFDHFSFVFGSFRSLFKMECLRNGCQFYVIYHYLLILLLHSNQIWRLFIVFCQHSSRWHHKRLHILEILPIALGGSLIITVCLDFHIVVRFITSLLVNFVTQMGHVVDISWRRDFFLPSWLITHFALRISRILLAQTLTSLFSSRSLHQFFDHCLLTQLLLLLQSLRLFQLHNPLMLNLGLSSHFAPILTQIFFSLSLLAKLIKIVAKDWSLFKNAFGQESPSGIQLAIFRLLLRGRWNVHDWSQIGLKFEFVLDNELEDFVGFLNAQQFFDWTWLNQRTFFKF